MIPVRLGNRTYRAWGKDVVRNLVSREKGLQRRKLTADGFRVSITIKKSHLPLFGIGEVRNLASGRYREHEETPKQKYSLLKKERVRLQTAPTVC